MATNSSCRKVANLSKKFLSSPSLMRGNHTSVYDKNVEDNVRPAIVTDSITHSGPKSFWAPNPKNGVFGPHSEHNTDGERRFHTSSTIGGSDESVLEVTTFIRSLEDLEKHVGSKLA